MQETNFLGPKFLGVQISWGPKKSGAQMRSGTISVKVHIFWEGQKILRNLHRRFVLCNASQIYRGNFAKFCSLLRIYELYSPPLFTKSDYVIYEWYLTSKILADFGKLKKLNFLSIKVGSTLIRLSSFPEFSKEENRGFLGPKSSPKLWLLPPPLRSFESSKT
jgi:hypothetical protein